MSRRVETRGHHAASSFACGNTARGKVVHDLSAQRYDRVPRKPSALHETNKWQAKDLTLELFSERQKCGLSGTPVGRKAVTYLFILETKKEIILIDKTIKKHKAYFFLRLISYLLSPLKVTHFLGSALQYRFENSCTVMSASEHALTCMAAHSRNPSRLPYQSWILRH